MANSSKKLGTRLARGGGSDRLAKSTRVKSSEETEGSSELVVSRFGRDNGKHVFEPVGNAGRRGRVEGAHTKAKVSRLRIKGSRLIGRKGSGGGGGRDIGV